MNEINFEKNIEESIVSKELIKITNDLLEAGIDSVVNNEFIKEIPIVGTLHSLCKIGISIRDKIFLKKILKFLNEIKNISIKERIEFISKIESNQSYRKKVGDHLIMIIDNINDFEKAEIIGKLFSNTIKNNISYDIFLKLSHIVEICYIDDLKKIKKFEKLNECNDFYAIDALYNLGLLNNLGISGQVHLYPINHPIQYKRNHYQVNELGGIMLKYIL